MATLTVTAKGQVTFRKNVLEHLGVRPGDKVEVDLLPNGSAALSAVQQKASFRTLHEFLKGKTNSKVLTMDEINNAIADAGFLSFDKKAVALLSAEGRKTRLLR